MEFYKKQMLLSPKNPHYGPITSFFILTFCFSWLFWIPMIFIGREVFLLRVLGTYGPTTIALFITGLREKKKGVVELLESFRRWKVGIFWYLFSFFSTAVLTILSISIYLSLERNNLVFNDIHEIYLVVPVFLFVLVFSVLGEEIGWRGFALPKLQEKIGPLRASLIIGVIWGFWHLPLFFIEGNFHQDIPLWLFILQDVALSIVMCWMYNHTKGSLLIIHLFHAASNTTLGVLPILPMDTGGDLLPLYILCGFLVALALIIVLTGHLGTPTNKPLKETLNSQR